MSYYVMPELLQDHEFCRRLRHCFLVREPMRAILSYYRLDPDISLTEIGYEMQWRQFDGLRALGIEDNPVIEAESIQREPESNLREFCRRLGLEHKPSSLGWDSDSIPDDWQYVSGWHEQVTRSRGNTVTYVV